MEGNSEGFIPDIVEHPIVHVSQRYDWDCGLACILMVLGRQEKQKFLSNFRRICDEGQFGESTWTIDLCYILNDFNIPHKYLTTTVGANPKHRGNDYYKSYTLDMVRVNDKFRHAEQSGLDVKQCSVNYRFLIDHLGTYGNIILLTSASMLFCDLCKLNKLPCELRSCLSITPSYTGHYIVLCGYNKRIQKFMYRNPACNDKVCYIPYQALDKARKANGTDEDIILLYDKTS
ncbi:protein GUCD1-like [Anopheles cruzii]|uniref:protein GUCD1-like n=1 Tax=Anopheles cruzii TaxID=68878 RepID=UPI0022EC3532|nr:protein GUCD1-like [Anopheles cruzii]